MQEVKRLKKEFKRIRKMGWVRSVDEGKGSVGLTLEKLLGKEKENFELPDYLGIELKTHKKNSKSYTTLFNATPDGRFLFEIKRLQQMYGYPDRILKYCKVLHGEVNAKEKNKIGLWYSYQLEVDYCEERVYLCIYRGNRLIDRETFWSFSWLQEKLERKLSILAFIRADEKEIDGFKYFKYMSIEFYRLKSFSSFLKALEKGKVIVVFTIGVFRKGEKKGQIHDHGTAFRMKNKDFWRLFYFG